MKIKYFWHGVYVGRSVKLKIECQCHNLLSFALKRRPRQLPILWQNFGVKIGKTQSFPVLPNLRVRSISQTYLNEIFEQIM